MPRRARWLLEAGARASDGVALPPMHRPGSTRWDAPPRRLSTPPLCAPSSRCSSASVSLAASGVDLPKDQL